MMELPLDKHRWQGSKRGRLESIGIQVHKSKRPKTCQLCWGHQSRYRRECPICGRLIAPGCWPERCWSDELNHCKDCHALICVLKHHRFKGQYITDELGNTEQVSRFSKFSYVDFPIGVQINIMMYLFQIKDFIWSGIYMSKMKHLCQKEVGALLCSASRTCPDIIPKVPVSECPKYMELEF